MFQKSSNRKTPVRHFNSRLIHKGKSYTAKEIAAIYGIDESVVHRWHREEGLISIDDKTPAIYHFETIRQFLDHKNNSRKMKVGNEGDFPCFKCKLKRRAFEDKIVLVKRNDKLWNAKARCFYCGSKMNMGVPASEFVLAITWGYKVVQELPRFSIIGTTQPTLSITQKQDDLKPKFKPKEPFIFFAENERIKHRYFDRVIHRFGKNNATLRKIVSAIQDFEEFNNFTDFKLFKYETAKDFQKYLIAKYSHSTQSAHRTIQAIQEFFLWLKEQNGYKKLVYDDIKSLRLSLKDVEKAKTAKPRKTIDIEKWEEMILNINPKDEVELRGRAMFSCMLLSGIRIDALISLKIGDLNLDQNYIFQDSNHVNTKFSSSHKTNLWQFKPEIKAILIDWVKILKTEYNFTDQDPLFPRIQIIANDQLQFEKSGFRKDFIKQPAVIRQELAKQFENANLDYHTPHTIRHSLTSLFMGFDLTMEQIKAVSQNLSHKSLETTFNSYYNMDEFKKDQTIEGLDIEQLKKIKKIKNNPKYKFIMSQMNNEELVNKVFEVISKES
jgi:integrase/recombinase XerD